MRPPRALPFLFSPLSALPEAQREVVSLKYLEGLSYEEIAEATGATVSSVESRLHRARAKLKDLFEGRSENGSGG